MRASLNEPESFLQRFYTTRPGCLIVISTVTNYLEMAFQSLCFSSKYTEIQGDCVIRNSHA